MMTVDMAIFWSSSMIPPARPVLGLAAETKGMDIGEKIGMHVANKEGRGPRK